MSHLATERAAEESLPNFELGFASSILVAHAETRPFATDMLGLDSAGLGVVVVAAEPSLSRWLREWNRRHPSLLGRIHIIDVGGSFGRGPVVDEMTLEEKVSVETIPTPGDLVGQGLAISSIIEEFDAEGLEPLVIFPSLTQALQYVSPDSLYRFLDVLRTRLHDSGATGVFYIDADAHDRTQVTTLSAACDAFVTVDDDEVVVRG